MITQLVADRHEEFPITRTRAFFAHAAFAPLPTRVLAAIMQTAGELSRHGQGSFVEDRVDAAARQAAASLLSCSPHQIAYVANTSTGMSLVAGGIRLRPGRNIVLSAGDFPAVINPWLAAAHRQGASVRLVDAWQGQLLDAVDDRTEAVAVSTTHFATGRPVPDLHATARHLQNRGILVVIDAIQTLGTTPFDVDGLDVVVADGHKWLLGPKGAAILYASQTACARIEPTVLGWRNMAAERAYGTGLGLVSGARRFEAGSLNILGMAGMQAAIDLLTQIGLPAVRSRLATLIACVTAVLDRHGLSIPVPTTPLICVPMAAQAARSLIEQMELQAVSASLRHDARGGTIIRIAPHFYNNDEDIHRLEQAIVAWRRGDTSGVTHRHASSTPD